MEELLLKNRRDFLKLTGKFAALSIIGSTPLAALASDRVERLTILHTNDVHSRIEPFPLDGGKYQGLGGVARRAQLISEIRNREDNVILLDAGDMVQGTPYFNLFKGKPELELMSKMKYDAGTLGNHEFDNGLDGLNYMMGFANFPFLTSNYNFDNTVLKDKTQDYIILKRGRIKVGVFGVGIELKGMVDPRLCDGVQYLDPIAAANKMAERLRHDYKCDLVVCLSHLGYKYSNDKVSDLVLAASTRNIDVIIGGHTHTFLTEPDVVKNIDGKPVIINQVGFAGISLGRLDFTFQKGARQKGLVSAAAYPVDDSILIG